MANIQIMENIKTITNLSNLDKNSCSLTDKLSSDKLFRKRDNLIKLEVNLEKHIVVFLEMKLLFGP